MEYQYRDLDGMNGTAASGMRNRQAQFLGKRIEWLFWLIIPSLIASIMTHQKVVQFLPALRMPGEVLSLVTVVIYGVILLQMHGENQRYLISGVCMIVSSVMAFGTEILKFYAAPSWGTVVMIPTAVVELCAVYYEYSAHSQIVASFDEKLSKGWRNLWKWYIGVIVALFLEIGLMLLTPLAGLIVMLITSLIAVVVSVMKLVYLYRTAQLLQRCAEEG